MAEEELVRAGPFGIQDNNEFAAALSDAIMDVLPGDPFLVPMHERVSALTHHERLFVAVYIFNSEMSGEGVDHFLIHGCGDLYEYVIEGLKAIGMSEAAKQLQDYVEAIFGTEFPLDEGVRKVIMLKERAAAREAFADDYETSARISERLATWARNNRAQFGCGVFHPG